MQLRFVLALCVFALFVAAASAQAQAGQLEPSFIDKLKERAERLIHESIIGTNAAVHCMKEAGEHCKDELKLPLNNYVQCSVDYIMANKERCRHESEKQ